MRLSPAVRYAGGRVLRAAATPRGAAQWLRDRAAYQQLPGAERLRWRDSVPKLTDRLPTSPFDPHYFHQDTWAARRIAERAPARHVDVGSRVDLVGFLTAITAGDVRRHPAAGGRHRGPGRRSPAACSRCRSPTARWSRSAACTWPSTSGSAATATRSTRAARARRRPSSQRVLAPGGQLLFSLPGRPPARGLQRAPRARPARGARRGSTGSSCVEFAGVDDAGTFRRHRALDELVGANYACGMYQLVAQPEPRLGGVEARELGAAVLHRAAHARQRARREPLVERVVVRQPRQRVRDPVHVGLARVRSASR